MTGELLMSLKCKYFKATYYSFLTLKFFPLQNLFYIESIFTIKRAIFAKDDYYVVSSESCSMLLNFLFYCNCDPRYLVF